MLLFIYEIKTENRGYALPICNGVHMCIFRKPFFRDKHENVLFFIRDYLKFFTAMGVGSKKSSASSHMRNSVACDVFMMYIVFFLKDVCKKTYFLLVKKKKN